MKAVAVERESQALTINRKIFRAAASVAIFTAFAKLASMAKELAVARWFGRGDALDAFLIAFVLPSCRSITGISDAARRLLAQPRVPAPDILTPAVP